MSMDLDRAALLTRIGLPLAFGIGCAHLLSEAAELGLPHPIESGLVVLCLTVLGMGLMGAAALRARGANPDLATRRRRELWLVPCVMAPLSVLSPWTLAPGGFGLGFGGLGYFLTWLTRYPTMGPVNAEVALGLGALLGAAAMPAFFALYAVYTRRLRPRVVATFLSLQMLAYVPVLVHLDFALLIVPPAVLPGPVALMYSAGAVGRLLATLAMVVCLVEAVHLPARRVTWETS